MLPLARDLAALLSTRYLGRTIRSYDAVGSTNTEAAAWAAEGAPEGSLVLAEFQQAGRGRHGRRWQASPGQNLTFSLVLRPALPPERLGLITLAAGVAVAETVEEVVAPHEVAIKWPNDILIDGRKCCGMLLESSLAGPRATVVLGIGLNVNQQEFPRSLAERATSLALAAGRLVPRAPLLADLLARLEHDYDALGTEAEAGLRRAYEARLHGRGERMTLYPTAEASPVRGVLLGVSGSGALRLRTDAGLQTFYAGEVTTRER